MVGAASSLLCIKDSAIIFNSPRWCALTAERELCNVCKAFEERLYCTEARQDTLVFGIEEALNCTLKEVYERGIPSLISVITSCSMSLIGDDIKGIATRFDKNVKFITMDAGGLTGSFANGFSRGLVQIVSMIPIDNIDFQNDTVSVNILGLSTAYPHWEGDVYELKRLLSLIGIRVNIVLGIDALSLDELIKIRAASMNIVVDRELGLEAANLLKERHDMPFIVALCPYGFTGSIKWLQQVADALNMNFDKDMIKNEILGVEEKIAEYCSWIQHNLPGFCLKQFVSSLPHDRLKCLIEAFYESSVDLLKFQEAFVKVSMDDCCCSNFKLKYWQDVSQIPTLLANEKRILLASDRERILLSEYDRTIYVNIDSPAQRMHCTWTPFVGLKGWQNLVSNICEQIITLEHIRNS